MIFDDDFTRSLFGDPEIGGKKKPEEESEDDFSESEEEKPSGLGLGLFQQKGGLERKTGTTAWSSEYGNADGDYVIESDLISPTIEVVEAEETRKLIVVVDDDFDTLDLMKIYLQRDYEYEGFSGPREAIFYLNQHRPSLVMVDCKIHTMKALTFASIVRAGKGNENVPIVLMGTEEELAGVNKDFLPDYVVGFLKRPVARKNLQDILDTVIK